MKPDAENLTPKTNFLSANWREIVFTILAIAAFFVLRLGVQKIDPTAAVTDFGAIDIILFAATASLAAHLAVWVILRIALKTFHLYLDGKDFRREFFGNSECWGAAGRIFTTLAVVFFELWLLATFAGIVAGQK